MLSPLHPAAVGSSGGGVQSTSEWFCIAVWVKPSVNKTREMVMISFRRKRTVIWSMHPGTGYWCSGRVQVAGHPHWHPAEMEDLHRGSIQEGDEQAPFPKTAESFQCVEQNPGDFLLPRLCCDVLWEQQSGWTDKLGWLCNWLDTKLWWRGGHWSNQWSILITYWTDWHLGKKYSNAKI